MPFIHTDINECMENTDNCTELQMCQNTAGSFICPCIAGYRPSSSAILLCEGKHLSPFINYKVFKFVSLLSTDINECDEFIDDCAQMCINNDGSFSCSCRPGFELNSDNANCTRK